MVDGDYLRPGPWRGRWPLSRIARYCFIFVMGAFAGHGLLALFTEHQATWRQQGNASIERDALDKQELDSTVREAIRAEFQRIERRKQELNKTVREAIRAEFETVERRILALETRTETSADPADTPVHESSRYLAHVDQPPELDASPAGGSSLSD